MTLAASGCVSLTLDAFRNTLAASATFKELMDATTAAEAKAVTWWIETDDDHVESQAALPRAVVAFSPGQYESNVQGTQTWGTNSPVELLIEVETPAEYRDDLQNGNMWWLNKIGAIIDEVKVLAGTGGTYSDIRSMTLDMACRGDPASNNGRAFYAAALTARIRGL